MDSVISELRIWKHSHGTNSLTRQERENYRNKSVLTIYRDTGKRQGENFRAKMRLGDFFYLCHGNNLELFGQVVSGLEKSNSRWVERRYRIICKCPKGLKFNGPKKYWAPNANSTSKLVPQNELALFEKRILIPFFSLRLADLRRRAFDEVVDGLDFDVLLTLSDKEYVEARQKLIRHQRIERVRNQELVKDAKNYFKSIHKRLFCEVCDFDFKVKFGGRGQDFIEAHHRIPIAKLKPGTRLKISDLAMVCANCHRMLHQLPWISIENLRDTL
jgi:hypothetical protein